MQWKIFLDEDISPRIADALHAAGYFATSVRDRDLLQGYDWDHLRLCLNEDMVLCTKNPPDYEEQTELWTARGELHCGVLAVGPEWSVEEMIEAIIDFLANHHPNDVVHQVVDLTLARVAVP